MALECLLHAAFSWENFFIATSADFTQTFFLTKFLEIKRQSSFYNKKRITSIYKTYKRQKLVCVGVCVSVLYVRMFVCEDVYVTFETSYKHKTRPRNNWCAPHRSAARGAFICLNSTLPTRLWISVKQMWTFQVRTKVSIYSSPKHENMNFLRQQCRPICESILIYTASYTENLHFFTNIKRLSLWWSNFWIASYNDFWTHHYGNILFVNSCNEETLIFLHAKTWRNIKKKKFSESIPPSRNRELSAQT